MPRSRLNLDGTWHFFLDPTQRLSQDALAGETPRAIQVPGPWQAQFDDLRDYSGVAWYRRVFDAGTEDRGLRTESKAIDTQPSVLSPQSWFIHFGAVDYHATVWLNGQLLGEHEGGYLPF